MPNCPVCNQPVKSEPTTHFDTNTLEVMCETCGHYRINAFSLYNRGVTDLQRAALSHSVRRHYRPGEQPVMVIAEWVDRVLRDPSLPDASEQADRLVLWLGDQTRVPGQWTPLIPDALRGVVGALGQRGVVFSVNYLHGAGFVDWDQTREPHTARLTFKGWQYYAELIRGSAGKSRKAFMAMKYGDAELDEVFSTWFKPASKQTGFDLFRLDEEPVAGIIDDRLRIAIRTARFLVADLTHDNRGVYWEAGFAEGLGRPVIYTCRKDVFDQRGTHFDTNHLLTVTWEPEKLADAAGALKLVIRATLPEESLLED